MKKLIPLSAVLFALLLFSGGCRTIKNYFFPIAGFDQKTSLTNLKMIGLAMTIYAADNRDFLVDRPGAAGLNVLSDQYIKNLNTFVAPFDGHREKSELAVPMHEEQVSYAWLGNGVNTRKIAKPFSFPVAMEKPWIRTDGAVGVLYLDGHVGLLRGEFMTCEEVVLRLKGDDAEPYWDTVLENARAIDQSSVPQTK